MIHNPRLRLPSPYSWLGTRVSRSPAPPRLPATQACPKWPPRHTHPALTLKKPGEELADRGMRLRPGHMSAEEVCDPKCPSDSHPFSSFNSRPLLSHHCESYTVMAPSEKSTCPGSQNTPSSSFQAPRAQVTCALPNLPSPGRKPWTQLCKQRAGLSRLESTRHLQSSLQSQIPTFLLDMQGSSICSSLPWGLCCGAKDPDCKTGP